MLHRHRGHGRGEVRSDESVSPYGYGSRKPGHRTAAGKPHAPFPFPVRRVYGNHAATAQRRE